MHADMAGVLRSKLRGTYCVSRNIPSDYPAVDGITSESQHSSIRILYGVERVPNIDAASVALSVFLTQLEHPLSSSGLRGVTLGTDGNVVVLAFVMCLVARTLNLHWMGNLSAVLSTAS